MTFKDCVKMKVDFMDQSTGLIYKIQAYMHDRDMGLPLIGLPVVDPMLGKVVGYVENEEMDKFIEDK